MIRIMEGNEENSTFQWFTSLLQHYTHHFESLQKAAELYKTYNSQPYKNYTFKVSALLCLIGILTAIIYSPLP